jgi:3-oxoadipate enol-lactonase
VSRVAVGEGSSLEVVVEGDPAAPPLVLVHAAGADHRMWDRNLPALRDRFRLIRYDARGHGRSDVPPAPYTLDDLGTDLVAVLDALGVASAHVVGASLGGLVALWLAVRHPERVRGAVFAGASARFGTPEVWEERADAVRRDGTEAVVDLVMHRFFSERFLREEAGVVAGFADVLRRQSPEGYVGTCLALRDADLRGEVPTIRAPSLVVVGDEDASAPPPDAEALRAAIPDARLLVLEDAGHLCTVERPGVFEDIVAYLNEEAG